MAGADTFRGRPLTVATLHGKERAIGPAFRARLGVAEVRVAAIDTERFGAFSGEVARELDPRAAAEAKARAALAGSGGGLAIASEGSFAPYPAAPLLTLDEEWLVLVDARDGRAYAHRHATLDAVFAGRRCESLEALLGFVALQPFPEHALVLRPREHWRTGDGVHKGIVDRPALERIGRALLDAHGELWVETDLRAHCNPTRMRAIERAASAFAEELATHCPGCDAPHFRVLRSLPGLPCSECGEPTELARALERRYDPCGHLAEVARPDGLRAADAAQCGACNP